MFNPSLRSQMPLIYLSSHCFCLRNAFQKAGSVTTLIFAMALSSTSLLRTGQKTVKLVDSEVKEEVTGGIMCAGARILCCFCIQTHVCTYIAAQGRSIDGRRELRTPFSFRDLCVLVLALSGPWVSWVGFT